MSTFTYLLSPPRRKSDVVPPNEPDCMNTTPATDRSASAMDVTPRVRSSSPVTTLTVAGALATDIGVRVAVTTTGAIRAVSDDWAATVWSAANASGRTSRVIGRVVGVWIAREQGQARLRPGRGSRRAATRRLARARTAASHRPRY